MHNCSVLHVEDEDASACLVRSALEEAHIAVCVYRVCDGEEALRFLRKQGKYETARTPEFVLLDLSLPNVDGWTVLGEMQQSSSLSNIPVIVLSASSSPRDKEMAEQLGVRRYVTKPSSFDGLVQGMKSVCNEYLNSGGPIPIRSAPAVKERWFQTSR
jgi:CheY-like chemotaxis protein